MSKNLHYIKKRKDMKNSNLKKIDDDEIDWFEDLTGENEEDIATELADLMDKAGAFYDKEMKDFE